MILLAAMTLGASAPAIVREAQSFMAAYASDLSRRDAAAVAARYHSAGTIFLGNGNKQIMTKQEVTDGYLKGWRGPARFAWRNLDYEPVGMDAVVVTGLFEWTSAGAAAPEVQSYVGLLRRENGTLKIRIEDESRPIPKPTPAKP